jgi:hypothetical protein
MTGYLYERSHDSHKLLAELDMKIEEKTNPTKEITLRFSDRQYEMLRSFDALELKEQLNIMQAVTEFIVKQIKNGPEVQK